MMDFWKKRKKLVYGMVAGAAGAAAAYYWYQSNYNTKLQQQRSIDLELNAYLRQARSGPASGGGAAEHAAGRPGSAGGGSADGGVGEDQSLDESMDSHFGYIQGVSTPQELNNLLPRIKEVLWELTDVALAKVQAAQQHVSAEARLRHLAQLCFGRTVAACYLLPLMDLAVRTKLNIIGRHLFLQEKLSKLHQPDAPAARLHMPPKLSAMAVEAFLRSEHFVNTGCAWVAQKAMEAAGHALSSVSLDTPVSPERLVALLQDAVAAMEGLVVGSEPCNGPATHVAVAAAWGGVLLPATPAPPGDVMMQAAAGTPDAYRRAMASAAMAEELDSELRVVLSNYRFVDALRASVEHCFNTCASHLHATLIAQAAQQQQAAAAQAQAQAPPAALSEKRAPAAAPAASGGAAAEPGRDSPTKASPFSTTAVSGSASSCGSGSGAGPLSPGRSPPWSSVPARSGSTPLGALTAAAMAAQQPRPLARCLRAVQAACDPLFADTKEVTLCISNLPRVMSLCACAFAAPPLQL